MKILITGANGLLGQDLIPILEDESYDLIETNIDTLDVSDLFSVKRVLETEKPDLVIHCAAYTDVDGAEGNPDEAYRVNTLGTENIAKICSKNNIKLIYISTDYVFDGKKDSPYTFDDKPNPINIYGKTKLDGELAIQKYCEKFYIIRSSWLYGHYGDNFVEKMVSISDTPEIKVVNDQIGCPTWTVDLANAIADLIDEEPEYGIYHICGGGQASWFEFAQEVFKLLKKDVNLIPVTSEEFNSKANRPKYSVMDNGKTCRHWKLALKDYLDLR